MATETNPNTFATVEQGGGNTPPIAIQDGVDFPHTGLIKALQQGMQGNYAIKGAANEFDITQQSSDPVLSVTAGNIYQDNLLTPVTTNLTFNASDFNKAENNYHLLVAEKAGGGARLAIRKFASPTVDKVPPINQGDAVIALIKYTGSDASNGLGVMQVQYLTTSKIQNQLSISQGSSGDTVFTEAARLVGGGTTVDFITQGNRNLAITPDGTGELRLNGLVFPDSDGNANQVIKTDGAGNLSFTNQPTQYNDSNAVAAVEAHTPTLSLTGALTSQGSITGATGLVASAGGITATTGDINASAGSINANVGVSALTGNIIAVQGDVAGGSISQTNILGGLQSVGKRTKSRALAADATFGGYSNLHAYPSIEAIANLITVLGGPALNPVREHYYIGFDSQTVTVGGNNYASNSHSVGGVVIDPTTTPPVGSNTNYETLTKANSSIKLSTQANAEDKLIDYTYNPDDTFGNGALFFALGKPEDNTNRTVTLHNITSFAMYIVIVDNDAQDPSLGFLKNKVNGGYRPQEFFFNQEGNEKCVDMSEILLDSQLYASNNDKDRDAILLKPRESVTLQAIAVVPQEIGSQPPNASHENDVFAQQGLFAGPTANSPDPSQWFITSSTGNNGNANVVRLTDALRHIPVHLTGTTFICTGTNHIMLPNRPPIGTQYSFLITQGTTNIHRPIFSGNQKSYFSTKGLSNTPNIDEFYELSTTAVSTLPLAITAGNGKTFIYTQNQQWQIIG